MAFLDAPDRNSDPCRELSGWPLSEAAMKTSLSIVLAAVLVVGSSLAIMNSACKSNHHSWCAPMSDFRQYVKTRHADRVERY
jgi:hypothetical protein